MDIAPILLFTFKRLDTLRLTVDSLKDNYLASQSELYIFSDGPKSNKDIQAILEVRNYLKSINGFKSISIYESDLNKGLAKSIIEGVNYAFSTFNKVIVLEDDLITTPNFLNYMNSALCKYSDQKHVFSISGFSFRLGNNEKFTEDAYFLNRGWSWGWATWNDRWSEIDWLVNDYNVFFLDKKARKAFSRGGSDLNSMLDRQMSGKLDSWAIRWFYHQFRKGTLTLYPIKSKVYNNGFDDNATHTKGSGRRYQPDMDQKFSDKFLFPDKVKVNPFFQSKFQNKMSIYARIISKLETLYLSVTKYFK